MFDYYKKQGTSQSELKKYLKHPRFIKLDDSDDGDLYTNEDSGLSKGSIVDILATNANGQEIVEQNYSIVKDVKLSDTIKNIIRDYFVIVQPKEGEYLITFPEKLHEICNNREYYMNRAKENHADDKRVLDILEDNNANDYLEYLKKADGKILVSQEIYEKAFVMAAAMTSNDTFLKLTEGCDIQYQRQFFQQHFAYYKDTAYEFLMKGMLDNLLINEKEGYCIIVDNKSMSAPITDFYRSAYRYRYDIQGSFYKTFIKQELGLTCSFYNLVGSFTDPSHTEMFLFPDKVLHTARVGNKKKNILGWEDLITRKLFYEENGFNYTPEYITGGGMNIMKMYEDD